MVDLSDLGGASGRSKRFPEFNDSAIRMAVGGFPEFDQSKLDATTGRKHSAVSALEDVVARLTGESSLRGDRRSNVMETASRAIAEALVSHMGDYSKATRGLYEAFKPMHGVEEELKKALAGPPNRTAAEEIIESFNHRETNYGPLPYFEPPPNPIHETNEHLERVADKVEALLAVQAKQAEMIDSLLATIVQAAAESDKASKANLRIAKVTMWTALLAIIASIAIPLVAG